MQNKLYYIYILTNNDNKVLYTGITSNLPGRIYQHKSKLADGFTKKYNVDKLIYYEVAETAISAIARENKLKRVQEKRKSS